MNKNDTRLMKYNKDDYTMIDQRTPVRARTVTANSETKGKRSTTTARAQRNRASRRKIQTQLHNQHTRRVASQKKHRIHGEKQPNALTVNPKNNICENGESQK